MSMNELLQWGLVSLVLAWSLLQLVRKLLPGTSRAWQGRLADAAARRGWARFGRWLQPAGGGAGCDSGCGSGCDSCGDSGSPSDAPATPVQWRPDARPEKTGR